MSITACIKHAAGKNTLVRRWHIIRTGRRLFRAHPEWKRFADDWYRSRLDGRSSLVDQRPWLTYPTLQWLAETDWSGKRVFEWGGGGSTLFFLRAGAVVVTVEHDRQWGDQIEAAANAHGYESLDLRLHEPIATTNGSGCQPYTSTNARYQKLSFEPYVKTIDEFPDNSFDLILVDGRSRCACLNHAISKVADGGVILFDNAEREAYQDAIEHTSTRRLTNWKQIDLSGPTPYLWDAQASTLAWCRISGIDAERFNDAK
nr:class I SAM-dependent methyltransferase [Rosistilla oblonga]